MSLEADIQELELFMKNLVISSKSHTITEMVMGDIPVNTICRFNQSLKKGEVLSFTSITLRKISIQLDKLEVGVTNHHYKDLKRQLNNFIKKYILSYKPSELEKVGINYKTLKKLKDTKLKSSYRINTLIDYAYKAKSIK